MKYFFEKFLAKFAGVIAAIAIVFCASSTGECSTERVHVRLIESTPETFFNTLKTNAIRYKKRQVGEDPRCVVKDAGYKTGNNTNSKYFGITVGSPLADTCFVLLYLDDDGYVDSISVVQGAIGEKGEKNFLFATILVASTIGITKDEMDYILNNGQKYNNTTISIVYSSVLRRDIVSAITFLDNGLKTQIFTGSRYK